MKKLHSMKEDEDIQVRHSQRNYSLSFKFRVISQMVNSPLDNLVINRLKQAFVSDITYVKSKEKLHYLSLVTNTYSLKIISNNLSDNMDASNVAKALKKCYKKYIQQLIKPITRIEVKTI